MTTAPPTYPVTPVKAGCAGALCDVASGTNAAPSLRFDNANPNGNSFIKFDGIEPSADGQGVVLIDRKLKLADFNQGASNDTMKTFERIKMALEQNPGYEVVYEFPNAAIAEKARISIVDLGFGGLVTVRP